MIYMLIFLNVYLVQPHEDLAGFRRNATFHMLELFFKKGCKTFSHGGIIHFSI